ALALADDAGAARAAVVERGLSTLSITFRSRGAPWRCGGRAGGARAVRLQGITGVLRHMRHLCHDAVTPRCRPHPQEDLVFDAAFTPRRRAVLLSMAGVPVLLTACAETAEDGGGSGDGGGGDRKSGVEGKG